jgi:predicted O-linked N-acetylglucosamine transferase (SPINDLY family)
MAPNPETLQKALAHHNAGDLQQAEQEYRQILRIDPRHADALHLLGVIGQQRGEPALAVEYIGKAIAVNASNAVYHTNLAAAHLALQKYVEAESDCRRAIRLQPRYAEAHYNLGLALDSQGKRDAAVESYRQAIELKPAIAEAHLNLGNVLILLEKSGEAEACFRKAIEVRPRYALAHYNLGNILETRQRNDEAIECYQQAVACDSNYVDAWANLATVCHQTRRFDEAIDAFRAALRLNPQLASAAVGLGDALVECERLEEAAEAFEQAIAGAPRGEAAYNRLGQIRLRQGHADEAERCFRQAVDLAPQFAAAWNNLGVACYARGDTRGAVTHFRRSVEIEPGHVHANVNLGSIIRNYGQLDEAAACFQRVLESDPGNAKVRVLAATMLPPILSSVAVLDECRERFTNNVAALIAEGVRLDPETDDMPSLFYLPYQGQNDRDLQSDLARLYPVAAGPGPLKLSYSYRPGSTATHSARSSPPAARIHVGFISHFFRSHRIAHLMRGLISELSRERFHVTVLSIGDHRDEVAQSIRQAADDFVVLPANVRQARPMIAAQQLDILFYSDIGMDSYSYSLAFHRLAPVQCVTWGHPVTTGIPNVDYFLSSDLLEPDDADGHYTEHLVRLRGLPTFYYRPALPPQLPDRASCGLPVDGQLYLCPQSLFKFHPDFDVLLGAILARDPEGHLILLEGVEPAWTQMLRARFQTSFPESVNRVHFLPRQARGDSLNLTALCDVMLDPLHFGGGNSTYEALALGIPVVTLPSPFMRGRVTAACYRKMGMADCIADTAVDYVKQAIRLGTDPEYRGQMRARILAANHALFEDRESLHEIEDFLEAAVERARSVPAARPVERADGGTEESIPRFEVAPAPLPVSQIGSHSEIPDPKSDISVPHSDPGETAAADPTPPSSILDPPSSVPSLTDLLRTAICPACGHHVAVPFYDGGKQPLATVAWPRSATAARSLKRLPLDFLRCVDCGHVYNCRFDHAEVPCSEKPNLMFNKGVIWTDHLRTIRDLILQWLPAKPVVVEVGCGEGHLLRAVAERRPSGRYVGFDPRSAINSGNGLIEVRRELFDPARHLAELRPDVIISRHVLEHLMNPLAFIQSIAFATSWENIETRLFIEVPCIDRVIRLGRTVDFFYEHNSNFTTKSLERLLTRCASRVETVARGYNDEVVYGVAHFCRRENQVQFTLEAVGFSERSARQQQTLRTDLHALAASGRRVAVWGGTGKAAAFINQFGLDTKRFPLVVDSDVEKAGTYVPGGGQEILYRDFLIQYPVEVILIATQWRAGDIVAEIERCGIPYQTILLEHAGRLVDYFTGDHPYRAAA